MKETENGESDEQLLSRLQRGAFDYFLDFVNPSNGLVADTSRAGSPCSIACVGFALSSYPVGVERGWIERRQAVDLTLSALRFFASSEQGEGQDATGHHGFYYHFLDMQTGKRVWQCELSLIDTALLLAGMLAAAAYFDGGSREESEIRNLADTLYRRVDWAWAQDGEPTISQGWRPDTGFLHDDWQGFNEAILIFILGLGSPTFPLPEASFPAWTRTYQWENIYGIDHLYAGALFIHLFPHAWIDFRGIQDEFMREKKCDYHENTRRAVAVQREYCRRNPYGYHGYGSDFWGITAGDGPNHENVGSVLPDFPIFGYTGRSVPFGPDDGTISPWAMAAALPYAPEAALSSIRNLIANHPDAFVGDRFCSGLNPTVGDSAASWVSEGVYGLDQGLVVISIENQRSDFAWRLMRSSPYITTGLQRAGFAGGWLSEISPDSLAEGVR